jgi:hypothetical protein
MRNHNKRKLPQNNILIQTCRAFGSIGCTKMLIAGAALLPWQQSTFGS